MKQKRLATVCFSLLLVCALLGNCLTAFADEIGSEPISLPDAGETVESDPVDLPAAGETIDSEPVTVPEPAKEAETEEPAKEPVPDTVTLKINKIEASASSASPKVGEPVKVTVSLTAKNKDGAKLSAFTVSVSLSGGDSVRKEYAGATVKNGEVCYKGAPLTLEFECVPLTGETSEAIVRVVVADAKDSSEKLGSVKLAFEAKPVEEAPAAETPAEETLIEEPAAEEPVLEEPAAEETPADEPAAEEPVAEETPAEEPAAEEPIAEETPAEEPAAEEPIAEETPAEEPAAEETPAEEPIEEEAPTEALIEEETPAEEPVKEEPKAEEPVKEEPAAEEPIEEETPAEEPVTEEPAAEEPIEEETPAEAPAEEETPAEEPIEEEAPAEAPAEEVAPAEEPAEEAPVAAPQVKLSMRPSKDPALLQEGDSFTLTAVVEGLEEGSYSIRWQIMEEGTWKDIEGAEGPAYTFVYSESMKGCSFRFIVTDNEPAAEAAAA